MFGLLKKMMCGCDDHKRTTTLEEAHQQDKEVREALTEKQLDKGLKDTMDASDPVAKY